MLDLIITTDLEKRLLSFLKKGSKLNLFIDPFSQKKEAHIQFELKEGLSQDIIEGIGKINVSLDFDSIRVEEDDEKTLESIVINEMVQEISSSIGKPALPSVNNEYDEVKDIIDSDLGSPVQTLHTMQKQSVSTPNVQRTGQKKSFVVPDPEPIPEKKSVESEQVQLMMKQMQLMQQQMQAMLSGKPMPVEEEPEEDFESIMTPKEFYEHLSKTGNDLPNIDFNKKLSKEEAVELEKYKIEKPAYVVSKSGMLFIDDVGISVRQNLACNLSSIPIFKLKKSSDLIRCMKNGMLLFVNYKTAKKLSEKADLTSATEGIDNKLKTYIGVDGSGVDAASASPIDVTPGVSDESASDRMMQLASRRGNGYGADVIVDDFDESISNESISDDQTDLINLTGGGAFSEDSSDALLASFNGRNKFSSKTWKPLSRAREE